MAEAKKRPRELDSLPDGWRYLPGSTTAPLGYRWACNGMNRFRPDSKYENALVKVVG